MQGAWRPCKRPVLCRGALLQAWGCRLARQPCTLTGRRFAFVAASFTLDATPASASATGEVEELIAAERRTLILFAIDSRLRVRSMGPMGDRF